MASGAQPSRSHDDSLASSHLSDCVSDETIAGTHDGSGLPPRTQTVGSLPLGFTVGRYVVLSKLGAGGMGVVYAAHDPELDRKVAVKLMRARGSPERIARGHERLLAEAQALARLSDPHVVTVHDVGEHDGQVFVAMEFVEGRTLAAWLRQARRSWPEVLEVMLQAGRGIVAAHARELVHCDFKPDNVMLGDDGRVRVMDFGLVQAASGPKTEDGSGTPRELPAIDPSRARAHGLVGTPAYMAPEQHMGGRGTMASDQYSFCVTAWEAFHGCRPFVGETLPALVGNILEGAIREPATRVPKWLRRTIERGMASDPARRWPSMKALLSAIERRRARSRRRKWLLGGAAVVGMAAAGLGGQRWVWAQQVHACEEQGAAVAAMWNEDQAAALREAMVGTGVSHAEVTAEKVIPWLDAQAEAWREARTHACVQSEVERTWEADTLDRSLWCLDERRRELQGLIAELLRGEPEMVGRAVQAASSLRSMDSCRDELTLSRQPIPPLDGREEIVAVGEEVGRADALQRAGQYDESVAVGRAALERAEALGWAPLVAMARRTVGRAHLHRGEYPEAEAMLELAFFEGARADALEQAALAAGDLSKVAGDRLARPADGLRWAKWEELIVTRLHDPSGRYHARALEDLALMRHVMGEHQEAIALYERAVGLYEQALGPEHITVSKTIGDMAIVFQDLGDHERAKTLNERILAMQERALGPDHPDVGIVLHNLARDHRALGAATEAKALYERALAIWEASLGPEHPHVAQVLNNLGNVLVDLGDYEQSLALHQRALAIRERVFGPDHPQVAQSLENVANTRLELGVSDELIALHERALAIRERTLGSEHVEVASGLSSLGRVLFELDRIEEAQARFEQALRTWDASVGPEHPGRAHTLSGLADVALAQGRVADAVASAEQALTLVTSSGAPAPAVAESRFVLARARWEAGADRAAARQLAEQARDGLRQHGHAKRAAEIEEWLASHPAP
ncbi:tetratricopeptide repeat-containing serine/threonine-protein kinase [Paraliomyxa miuraensis]|uniref:tetratricopeptide repeat-containing serine/threonine-protein kinase n=1 Tax=Paraliomyxa miuraensis TaxID=376150 RepID=UPI002255A436|nr:tetratricopeptide repeat-containing serine/threonine-protein kinase [Paraliomyxa miuraensis]MCX4242572.1 serine/threonine-protein kinase [Paraliomyxa miuraensis]